MIYAESVDEVANQREKFQKKWKLKCATVITSLQEAGEELFTFTFTPCPTSLSARTLE